MLIVVAAVMLVSLMLGLCAVTACIAAGHADQHHAHMMAQNEKRQKTLPAA